MSNVFCEDCNLGQYFSLTYINIPQYQQCPGNLVFQQCKMTICLKNSKNKCKIKQTTSTTILIPYLYQFQGLICPLCFVHNGMTLYPELVCRVFIQEILRSFIKEWYRTTSCYCGVSHINVSWFLLWSWYHVWWYYIFACSPLIMIMIDYDCISPFSISQVFFSSGNFTGKHQISNLIGQIHYNIHSEISMVDLMVSV